MALQQSRYAAPVSTGSSASKSVFDQTETGKLVNFAYETNDIEFQASGFVAKRGSLANSKTKLGRLFVEFDPNPNPTSEPKLYYAFARHRPSTRSAPVSLVIHDYKTALLEVITYQLSYPHPQGIVLCLPEDHPLAVDPYQPLAIDWEEE